MTSPAEQCGRAGQQRQQRGVPSQVPAVAARLVEHGARRAVAPPRGRRGRHLLRVRVEVRG